MKNREVNQMLKALVDSMRKAELSTATRVTIMCLAVDIDRTETAEKLLEATKDCKTDEEYLAAVRAVLQKGDDS